MITESEPYIDPMNLEQVGEVKRIEWKTLEEIKETIRPDNINRIKILDSIDKLIHDKYFFNEDD
jgi:5-methylcytosine-specific restriction endonuclease McrBC GTP-binding regulatory subunit McrB